MKDTRRTRKTAVAVGTFDGVHRGHQAILSALSRVAGEEELERVAYAFHFPPRFVLSHVTTGLILPEPRKLELLRRGVDRVQAVDFADVAALPARRFVVEQLVEALGARAIVVGEGFRFGHGRRGDGAFLRRMAEALGLRIEIVPPLEIDGAPVSSTRIRRLITAGRVDQAARLLGRPPMLTGPVVPGDRLGRRLGYPTANLAVDRAILLPATGVYAAHAGRGEHRADALVYVGFRPTLATNPSSERPRCEVHLLSAPQEELYRTVLEAHLVKRLRPDRAFPSLDALRRQMDKDAAAARRLLADSPSGA